MLHFPRTEDFQVIKCGELFYAELDIQGGYRVDTGWIQGGYRVEDTGWIQGGNPHHILFKL